MLICNSCTVYIRYTHSYLEVLNSNDWFYILYFSVLSSDVRQDWVNVAMYLNNQNTTENTNITRKKIIFTFCTQNEYYISIACCDHSKSFNVVVVVDNLFSKLQFCFIDNDLKKNIYLDLYSVYLAGGARDPRQIPGPDTDTFWPAGQRIKTTFVVVVSKNIPNLKTLC